MTGNDRANQGLVTSLFGLSIGFSSISDKVTRLYSKESICVYMRYTHIYRRFRLSLVTLSLGLKYLQNGTLALSPVLSPPVTLVTDEEIT